MMSSAIPSAKYSCSGSALRLANGKTAIEGLSGSVRYCAEGRVRVTQMRQPVAAARHRDDIAVTPVTLVQRLAQRRDVDVQVVFGDGATRPQPGHQLVFADHGARGRCEQAQNVACAATKLH